MGNFFLVTLLIQGWPKTSVLGENLSISWGGKHTHLALLLSVHFCAVWAKGSFWCTPSIFLAQDSFADFAVLRNRDEDEKATLPDPKATFPDQKAIFADHVLARF